MDKFEKNLLKKKYLNKIPKGTIAENERFLNILKNQKNFNYIISLFKKNSLKLFINKRHEFENVIFMIEKTSLNLPTINERSIK